jgi:hypothetical protein
LPAGVSADDAIAILRADGRISDGELVVVIRRELCDDDDPAPTVCLGRPEPAETAEPKPDATTGATPRIASEVVRELEERARAGRPSREKAIDVESPEYQNALAYLRSLGAPYYYRFDAGDMHYVVSFRRAGLFDVEIARDSDARVVADAVRAHRACRVHLH